ncbi:MAG: metallophosphoesterase [Thermoleophilia bacterium]|nr:metallophosphoesterase [Thermoleophilia bacterium]
MTVRLVQLSDLHVGAHDAGFEAVAPALVALVDELRPGLVLATGDLTHRNRRDQHERAAAFLRSLAAPVLAIPGNHDLPALPPARVTRPFAAFLSVWPELEPSYVSERLAVCALRSVRPWKYQRGALSPAQLERAAALLSGAPAGALRVVALHHHLLGAPWRTGKRSVPHRSRVLAALAAAGAELVVSGHTHQSVVAERREFLHPRGDGRGLVVATAPGLGRPRPGRHAEAGGLQLYEADRASLRAVTYAWTGDRLEPVAERRYPRAPIAPSTRS